MISKQLKRLARLRLALSLLAPVLAALMVFSGVMHFWVDRPVLPEEPELPAATISQLEPAPGLTPGERPEPVPIPTTEPLEEGDSVIPLPEREQKLPVDPEGNQDHEEPWHEEELLPEETPPADPIEGANDNELDNNENNTDTEKQPDEKTDSGNAEQPQDVSENAEQPKDGNGDAEPHEDKNNNPEEQANTTDDTDGAVTDQSQNLQIPDEDTKKDDSPKDHGHKSGETGAVGSGENATSEQTTSGASVITDSFPEQADNTGAGYDLWGILFWASFALLAVDLAAILILSAAIGKEKQKITVEKTKRSVAPPRMPRQMPVVGTVHQVGRRDYQQDSLGHSAVMGGSGMLAVLADGMGGLSGGEKVSQQIVMNILTLGQQLRSGSTNGLLRKMLMQVNEDVNRSLGAEGLYKSGSTVVAVLVHGGQFQWISVGDSRIYLYRQGYVNQLNRDHDQLQNWMGEILDGKRSCEEALRDPDGRKLTSFIGMGQLKYVDASISAIDLEPGDRLVLMSDGVYGVLSEERLASVLKQYSDVNKAAAVIERLVQEAQNPYQDNFTAMILGF